MFTIIKSNQQDWISSLQLFDNAGFSEKTRYSDWAKRNILNNPFFSEEMDYVVSKRHIILVGKPRQEYLLNPDFAYKLAMQLKTEKGETIRSFLLKLLKGVQNKDLISIEEAALAANFINYFKYVENQKAVEAKYLTMFDGNYGKAHAIRNTQLDIDTEKVKQEYVQWCIDTGQFVHKSLNRRSMINCFDKYYNIRIALWDYCKANGLAEPTSFPKVVMAIAEKMKVIIQPKNEVNFFQTLEIVEELPKTIEDGMKLLQEKPNSN